MISILTKKVDRMSLPAGMVIDNLVASLQEAEDVLRDIVGPECVLVKPTQDGLVSMADRLRRIRVRVETDR